eukprot:3304198-Amphidinium_carterae.1
MVVSTGRITSAAVPIVALTSLLEPLAIDVRQKGELVVAGQLINSVAPAFVCAVDAGDCSIQ